MGIILVMVGVAIWFLAFSLGLKSANVRDVYSFTVAIEVFIAGAVLVAGGGVILAVDRLRETLTAKPTPAQTADA